MKDAVTDRIDAAIGFLENADKQITDLVGDKWIQSFAAERTQIEQGVAQLHLARAQYVQSTEQDAINDSIKESARRTKNATWTMVWVIAIQTVIAGVELWHTVHRP